MLALVARFLLALRSVIGARASREAEILVLRQQVLVLNRRSPARLRLQNIDRLKLIWLYRLFPSLLDAMSSSSRRPCSAGIDEASALTGAGSLGGGAVGRGSIANSAR
jgi:hypothetical protein